VSLLKGKPAVARLDCDSWRSTILDVVRAMKRCGFFTETGLREIATIWQAV